MRQDKLHIRDNDSMPDACITLSLPALLQIENDTALLDYRCADTGILLWPHLRTVFYRMALADFFYSAPLTGESSAIVPRSRIAAYLTRAVWRNAISHASGNSTAEVCLVSSSVGHQMSEGKVFNRLSDYFALQLPIRSVTVEEHFEWQWRQTRHNKQVIFHAPLQVTNAIGSRLVLGARHRAMAREMVKFVSERGERLLGWRPGPQREATLIKLAARKLAGMPQQMGSYEALLRKIRPKIALILGASYGPASTLIMAARANGIVTAEFQHGAIAPGHDGYNFAPALCNSEAYRLSLPEHFLSYGRWWNGSINAPMNMVSIGNPHRDQKIARNINASDAGNTVLLLSDGIDFQQYLQLAREIEGPLAELGMRVMIRPHPIERSAISKKYGTNIGKTIGLDQHDDLYASLGSCYAVVSELSTGLFEAAGIARRLFVWDTPKARFCFPTLPFTGFSSADALIQLLNQDGAGELTPDMVDAFWAKNWQANYSAFLEKHIGVTLSMKANDV